MGFWNKSKSENSKDHSSLVNWISLTEASQLIDIIENSHQRPQFIFKHSTRCGISSMVKGQFVRNYPFKEEDADLYLLDLLAFRPLSQHIADEFNVWHESPQLIVIRNGEVVKHASHGAILELDI
ncbi:MAG: bacillithiol system redox-active protein YtxJ [Flavobacteriaceae bacterium]|nr:bacillithiol system redox-active protein YtxJ [Flavobacteriaceae bacterium]NNL79128.1 bacillithiol system redox-active protein YtxJ [Flavobacteriaceae bacterium]